MLFRSGLLALRAGWATRCVAHPAGLSARSLVGVMNVNGRYALGGRRGGGLFAAGCVAVAAAPGKQPYKGDVMRRGCALLWMLFCAG